MMITSSAPNLIRGFCTGVPKRYNFGAVHIKRRLSRSATAPANSRFMVEESRVTREGYAAVDHYRLPGDLRGGLGAEEEHKVSDVLGLRYSPQGGEPLEGFRSRP